MGYKVRASYTTMMLVEGDLELAMVVMVSMNRLGIRGAIVVADVVDVVAEAWVDAVGTQNRNPNTKVKFGQKKSNRQSNRRCRGVRRKFQQAFRRRRDVRRFVRRGGRRS